MTVKKFVDATGVTRLFASFLTTLQDTVDGIDETKADLTSPAFLGLPTAPTPEAGSETTQIANTVFVKTEIDTAIYGAMEDVY